MIDTQEYPGDQPNDPEWPPTPRDWIDEWSDEVRDRDDKDEDDDIGWEDDEDDDESELVERGAL